MFPLACLPACLMSERFFIGQHCCAHPAVEPTQLKCRNLNVPPNISKLWKKGSIITTVKIEVRPQCHGSPNINKNEPSATLPVANKVDIISYNHTSHHPPTYNNDDAQRPKNNTTSCSFTRSRISPISSWYYYSDISIDFTWHEYDLYDVPLPIDWVVYLSHSTYLITLI